MDRAFYVARSVAVFFVSSLCKRSVGSRDLVFAHCHRCHSVPTVHVFAVAHGFDFKHLFVGFCSFTSRHVVYDNVHDNAACVSASTRLTRCSVVGVLLLHTLDGIGEEFSFFYCDDEADSSQQFDPRVFEVVVSVSVAVAFGAGH